MPNPTVINLDPKQPLPDHLADLVEVIRYNGSVTREHLLAFLELLVEDGTLYEVDLRKWYGRHLRDDAALNRLAESSRK